MNTTIGELADRSAMTILLILMVIGYLTGGAFGAFVSLMVWVILSALVIIIDETKPANRRAR